MKRTATLADEFIQAYLLSLKDLTEMRLEREAEAGARGREDYLSRKSAAERSQRVLAPLVLPYLEQSA